MHRPSNAAATYLLILVASSCASSTRALDPAPAAPPSATSESSPAPVLRPARYQAANAVLDADFTDAGGVSLGTLEDLWVQAVSGEVAGVVVAPLADRAEAPLVAAYDALVWKWNGAASPTPVAASAAEAFFETRDYSELFADQELSGVEGEITQVDTLSVGGTRALVLKVRDEDNLLHRVFVEPAHLVSRLVAALEVGRPVRAEGVLTRDGSGKLLIASALGREERTLTIRGPAGAVRWDALAEPFQSARDLLGRSVRLTDGSDVAVLGWLLDWAAGTLAYLVVDVDGVERALPWSRVRRAGATLEFQSDRPSLTALSVVTPEGLAPSP